MAYQRSEFDTSQKLLASQMPRNTARTKSLQQEQLEAALADAKNHLLIIPQHNKMALRIQHDIIAGYEQQLRKLTGDWTNG